MSMDEDFNPLAFLYEKAVEDDEWVIEIHEGFGGTTVKVAPSGKNDMRVSEKERTVRDEFVDNYKTILKDIYRVDKEYEAYSFEWYWHLGEAIHDSDIDWGSEYVNYTKLRELTPVNSVQERENALKYARKVYELLPDGNPEDYLPDSVDPDEKITLFAKMVSHAETPEEGRELLRRVAHEGITPINREFRVWNRVKGDPDLDWIATEVNREFDTYRNVETKAEKVEHIYVLIENDTPDRDEIVAALEE